MRREWLPTQGEIRRSLHWSILCQWHNMEEETDKLAKILKLRGTLCTIEGLLAYRTYDVFLNG